MTRRLKRNLKRIIIAAVLFLAAALLPIHRCIKLALYLAAYLTVGYDVLWKAARNILHGQFFDEQFLMAIATIGAFLLREYAEGVAVMLFYQVGEWFQAMAVGKSRRSIAALMEIRPEKAVVLRDGQELEVEPEMVQPGELILVRPGEKIPLDGEIIEGQTSVDASALTGESMPQDIAKGENVFSGAVNLSGVITVKVENAYQDGTVSRILRLMEDSQQKKAKVEGFITRFARVYTPCVVIGALMLFLIPTLLFGGSFAVWGERALVFLVVSCPCALVISVPLSFFGGIGGASKQGILIKGSNYMEMLSKMDTCVFDKTGTLTRGEFSVSGVHSRPEDERHMLDLAAALESYSNHPIANGIVRAHRSHLDENLLSDLKELPGQGITALYGGKRVYVGNRRLMENAGLSFKECHLPGTVIHIAEDDCYLGHVVVTDTVKAEAAASLRSLKRLGIKRTIMLTGDRQDAALAVKAEVGADEMRAQLMPQNKVEELEKIMQQGGTVAFIGDGINDAPALSRADLGIAMGVLGSDAAIEAADVVLMDDKLTGLPKAVKIARKTMGIVRQNIAFAIGVKLLVLALGALGAAGMWTAVFADVGVMILAILNAMRTLKQ